MITPRIVCSGEHLENKKMPKPIRKGIIKPNYLRHSIIRKLARRVGSKRVSSHVYPKCTSLLSYYVGTVVKDAIAYSENSKRKTVNQNDVLHSLRLHGMSMYT